MLLAEALGEPDPLEAFINYVSDSGIVLYPAQEEALLEIFEGNNVIMNTPTGSGKSLVAVGGHFAAAAAGGAACTPHPPRRWSARSSSRYAATLGLSG